jgi:oxygen-independent coproporphyrinogen-3 oxidase
MSAGIYLHIPFCRSRCSYCDFATDVFKSEAAVERYVSALVKEIDNYELRITNYDSEIGNRKSEFSNPKSQISNPKFFVDTIYFGGGTPSLLLPAQLDKILNAVHRNFLVAADAEITMEMNPATMTPETVRAYRNSGVNRASFGAQTFDDAELKRLGRKHTAQDVRETIELLRAADFCNVSFDLIAGLAAPDARRLAKKFGRSLEIKTRTSFSLSARNSRSDAARRTNSF